MKIPLASNMVLRIKKLTNSRQRFASNFQLSTIWTLRERQLMAQLSWFKQAEASGRPLRF